MKTMKLLATAPSDLPSYSAELMREQAYLVARGVRPFALLGHCVGTQVMMLRVATSLEAAAIPGAIPFVVDRKDGFADFGFAAKRWALDLYRWAVVEKENAVPDEHRHRVLGLLLGYSAEAIEAFEQERSGRLFTDPAPATSGLQAPR
jgi:hypothetical protein